MLKRSGAFLMAALLAMSTSVYAEEGVVTASDPVTLAPMEEEATAVPEPPTPAPVVTEAPEATSAPAVTEAPQTEAAVTDAPETEAPSSEATKKPSKKKKVKATAAPAAVQSLSVQKFYLRFDKMTVSAGDTVRVSLVLTGSNADTAIESFNVRVDVSGLASYKDISVHGGSLVSSKNGKIVVNMSDAAIKDGRVVNKDGKKLKLSFTAVPFADSSAETANVSLSLLNAGMGNITPGDRGGAGRVQTSYTLRLEGAAEKSTKATEVTEEAAAEATDEVTEEAAVEAAEDTAEEATEEVNEEVNEEAADQVTDEPAEEVADEVTEETSAEATEETADKVTEEASDEATDEASEASAEEQTEEPTEEAAEDAADEPTEEADPAAGENTTEDITDEVPADETEETNEEEQTPVEQRAYIEQNIPNDAIQLGDQLVMTAKLIGFENIAVRIQWQVDEGEGYHDLDGAEGETFTVTVDETNSSFAYRFVVLAEDETI